MPTVPPPPPTVNVTTAHRESLQRARAQALNVWTLGTLHAESVATTPHADERSVAAADMIERDAKQVFDLIDRLCAELDPDMTPVPTPIE